MPIQANYMGMSLEIADGDIENRAYFRYCSQGQYHLQRCAECSLLRYPPGPSCYWCGNARSQWEPVGMQGVVHSYTEVHHAIQPAFKAWTPYAILVVDLDEQRGQPTSEEALRVIGNLVSPNGGPADMDLVRSVGIGSRVQMTFTSVAPDLAIPNWALAEPPNHVAAWRAEV